MVSFLTDLVKSRVDKLIDGAIAESRYVCCFTSIAKEFKEEQATLEAETRTVGQRANVASRNWKDIAANVRHWEKEADKLIQEDIETKKKCFFGFCPDCIWRYKKGKDMANKIEKMKQLVEDAKKHENIGIPRPLPDVEFLSSQDYIAFEGRNSKYKEILEALKDENNFITGLHGMGGAGKTTVAIEVGKELKQSERFDCVIVTTVSNTPNIKKIQDEIAGPLDLKWDDCNESDRPKKLWSRLINGEKILVILDDVWDETPLEFVAIGIPKQDNSNGCRLLVTTRTKRVLNQMGCDKIIELEVLSKEDSRIMFQSYAGLRNNPSKSLIDKGHEIADECKGLPVAIAAVAGSLKGQESPEEWDVALKSLQNPHSSSIQGVDDKSLAKIYNCLKVSYDYLKDEKLKGLFLLCSVFPEDEEISVEILTRLGVGAGLFGDDYDTYNDARNQVVAAKNKLLDSKLLLEAGTGHVKMHDLVREVAQWIANQEIRTVNMSHKGLRSLIDREKNTKYLFWEGKVREMYSSSFGGSKLEILIASFNKVGDGNCVEVPNSFFENMTGLRVLHLDHKGSFYSKLTFSLPGSIQSLMNIRSLLVSQFDLGDISVLGNLQCLETLDLHRCKITELPHEITKLENFKLLKLDDCKIKRKNPFEVIGKCSFLEELYFKNSFNKFCKEINDFPKLQRYVISTESWSYYAEPKCVVLYKHLDTFSEATLKYFFQTAEALEVDGIKWQWRNLIPETVPVDQGMNDLVHLDLSFISELQFLINTVGSRVSNVFSKLVVLKLKFIENLEELCNGPLSSDSLKALEKLSIRSCKKLRSLINCNLDLCNLKRMTIKECPLLVSLFPLSTAQSLMMLEELKIDDCLQLESIITDEKRGEESKEEILVDDGDNDNKKKGSSMFRNLKVLLIDNCPQLEVILPFVSGDLPVPVLETISILSCDKLKYIFGQFVELGSLKKLKLGGSPNFIDTFSESSHPMPLSAKGSSSSLRDGFKAPTQLDPIKCNVFSWTHKCCYGLKYRHKCRSTTSTKIPLVSEDQPQRFLIASIWDRAQCFSRQLQILCNVTTIELADVSKIKSVFILSTARRMLQLETLRIENCDELKHIIVDIGDDNNSSNVVFPRLKHLNVVYCKQLEYIIGHYADDHQSHNEIHLHLPELKSLVLKNLPNLVAMCPKQYHTTIPSLVKLEIYQVESKSIGDFIGHASSKERCGNMEHFLALEELHVYYSKVENVFFLNETNGQQLNLMLQKIDLVNLHVMTYLFVGPKSSVTLRNLKWIEIERCEKLEIVFSTSVVRCLSQLRVLTIKECKELKHIIEDDAEDEMMSNSLLPGTCFPKLEKIKVVNCNKLEFVFPVSICKELHNLEILMIREADALQEIFRSKDAQKVEIPNLKVIVFVNLPSLSQTQAIQFQNVEHRLVENCQKLSLTSVSSTLSDLEIFKLDWGLDYYRRGLLLQVQNQDPHNDLATGIEVQATSGDELSSSQCLEEIQAASASEKDITTIISTNSETRSKPPTQSVSPKSKQESFKTSGEEGTTLVTAKIVTSSTHSESMNSSSSGPLVTSEHKTSSHEVGYGNISIPSLSTSQTNELRVKDGNLTAETSKDLSVGVEVQAALGHKLISSQEFLNEPSTSQQCLMSQQHPVGETNTTAKPSKGKNCLEETKDQSIQEVLISEKATTTGMQIFKRSDEQGTTLDNVKTVTTSTHLESVSSSSKPLVTFEHKTSLQVKDDEIRVSEPKASPTTSSLGSQSISTPYEGNPSQIVDNPSSSSLITWELQQLVSKNHLASENLSLLTDFLVKHPSVRLMDNSLSNRYKGYAYNCLAELLKFLQTHNVLNVLESSRSELVELLQDARRFGFDRGWLDGVERRALFPNLQVSQDVLEKILHFKQQVSQHVEDLKHQLTSSEAVLESVIQQEAQVLESMAALSAPLGY